MNGNGAVFVEDIEVESGVRIATVRYLSHEFVSTLKDKLDNARTKVSSAVAELFVPHGSVYEDIVRDSYRAVTGEIIKDVCGQGVSQPKKLILVDEPYQEWDVYSVQQ